MPNITQARALTRLQNWSRGWHEEMIETIIASRISDHLPEKSRITIASVFVDAIVSKSKKGWYESAKLKLFGGKAMPLGVVADDTLTFLLAHTTSFLEPDFVTIEATIGRLENPGVMNGKLLSAMLDV